MYPYIKASVLEYYLVAGFQQKHQVLLQGARRGRMRWMLGTEPRSCRHSTTELFLQLPQMFPFFVLFLLCFLLFVFCFWFIWLFFGGDRVFLNSPVCSGTQDIDQCRHKLFLEPTFSKDSTSPLSIPLPSGDSGKEKLLGLRCGDSRPV